VKRKGLLLSLLAITFSFLSCAGHAEKLRLVVPQFPPYTSESDGVFFGVGIDLVKQVMEDINVDYQLRSTPNYARALEELIGGNADGFFLASEGEHRNRVAVFSEPLLINRWSWFFRADSKLNSFPDSFKSTAKIATLRGSNTYKWLNERDYNVTTNANSTKKFTEMLLERKRIDAVFLASLVFNKELKAHGYTKSDYVEVVEKSKPFGIYISKEYLQTHPGFMQRLNASIVKIQDLN